MNSMMILMTEKEEGEKQEENIVSEEIHISEGLSVLFSILFSLPG